MTKEAEPEVADPHLPRPQTSPGQGAGGCGGLQEQELTLKQLDEELEAAGRGLREQELKLKQLSFLQTPFLCPSLLLVAVLFLYPEKVTLRRSCQSRELAGGGGCADGGDLVGR